MDGLGVVALIQCTARETRAIHGTDLRAPQSVSYVTAVTSVRSLSRREALQRIFATATLAATLDLPLLGAEDVRRLGWDPNLLEKEIPWPRLLTDAEKRLAAALADVIIPADEHGPPASAVGVADFIDEWISAPYEQQRDDRTLIRGGLAWIDAEALRRHGSGFIACSGDQQAAIVDAILQPGGENARPPREFFVRFRYLVVGGYYTTPDGWRAIGYTGNVPLGSFDGPPRAVLERLDLV